MRIRSDFNIFALVVLTHFCAANIATAGTISGAVFDISNNNNPIENIDVQFFDAQNAQVIATSITERSRGFYNSGNIPDGIYRVRFSGTGFEPQYAAGKDDFCTAPEFAVTADSNIVVNQGLGPISPVLIVGQGIAFQGTLIDGLTGAPAEGIQVVLKNARNGLAITKFKETIVTDKEGFFRAEYSDYRDVRVRFFDSSGRYFPEYAGTIPRADNFCLGERYSPGATYSLDTRLTPIPTDQQAQIILDTVDQLILPNNVSTSINAPIIRIVDFLTDANPNNDAAICAQINSFESRIDIQERTGRLSAEDANTLRQLAVTLKADLGC